MRRTSDEHSAEIWGQRVYVRFLDPATIEGASQELLDLAEIECCVESMPVPVEEVLEGLLGFHLEFDDLLAGGALGATLWRSRTVVVDESLDPIEHPERLGRYRFTISHEIGHIRLHGAYLAGLSEGPDEVDSQTGVGENFLDIQANLFASFLLMPTAVVRQALAQEKLSLLRSHASRNRFNARQLNAAMALLFQVSPKAMAIRLDKLGLPADEEIRENVTLEAQDEYSEAYRWRCIIKQLALLKSF